MRERLSQEKDIEGNRGKGVPKVEPWLTHRRPGEGKKKYTVHRVIFAIQREARRREENWRLGVRAGRDRSEQIVIKRLSRMKPGGDFGPRKITGKEA